MTFRPILVLALMLAASAASAQAVNKCVVNGRTVYQSEACPGGGGAKLHIEPGPSAAEADEAKRRADALKGQAAAAVPVGAAPASGPASGPPVRDRNKSTLGKAPA